MVVLPFEREGADAGFRLCGKGIVYMCTTMIDALLLLWFGLGPDYDMAWCGVVWPSDMTMMMATHHA